VARGSNRRKPAEPRQSQFGRTTFFHFAALTSHESSRPYFRSLWQCGWSDTTGSLPFDGVLATNRASSFPPKLSMGLMLSPHRSPMATGSPGQTRPRCRQPTGDKQHCHARVAIEVGSELHAAPPHQRSNTGQARASSIQVESDDALKSLISSVILSEKSAAFRDHTLARIHR
jgi:hypothetical protein